MSIEVTHPYEQIMDKSGRPLDNGLIYIGESGQNPEVYPIQVFYDEEFTLPVPQPIRTINGYFSRNGSPAKLFTKETKFSIMIKDKFKILQFTDLYASGAISGSGLSVADIAGAVSYVDSIADLLAINNPKDGQVVFVKSYKPDLNTGGGDFVLIQSSALTENLATVFKHNQVGYENYYWVRINFDVLTPEMCGANGTLQDSTDAIERFLRLCGQGYKGLAKAGKTYKTSRFIDVTYSKSVNIDFNGVILKPYWDIPVGFGVDGSIRYKHESGNFVNNISVNISNLNIDLTSFIPSVSTSGSNRRGIRGLMIENPEIINISNYKCDGSFYGSGLFLSSYRSAILSNILLPNCGMKINPNSDDTGVYDAAGDAIYLGEANGNAETTINGLIASSQVGYMGRCGIAIEQFTDSTTTHLVTLNNAHFDGYQRNIHQEDRGISRLVWVGGSAKRFSNLIFNLAGFENANYFDAYSVSIDVNPPFSYGGSSGLVNFQGFGDAYFSNCDIKYLSNVTERGNKFISGGSIAINNSIVDHVVSSKTHTLNDVFTSSSGGYLYYTSGNKGLKVVGGSFSGPSGTLSNIIRSVSNSIRISGNCKIQDCSIVAENTLALGRDKNDISDTEIVYTGSTPAVLFSGTFNSSYKLSNVNIRSSNSRVELHGDGATRYSINDSEFVNVGVNVINAGATNPNGILKIRNCELYYSDSYGLASPISNSFGTVYAIISDNMIFDGTTAQNISLPAASASIKLDNNHFVKGGVIT